MLVALAVWIVAMGVGAHAMPPVTMNEDFSNRVSAQEFVQIQELSERMLFLYRICAVDKMCAERFYLGALRAYMHEAAIHTVMLSDFSADSMQVDATDVSACTDAFRVDSIAILVPAAVDEVEFRQFKELFVGFLGSPLWPSQKKLQEQAINNCTAALWLGIMSMVPRRCTSNERWSDTHGRCYCPPNVKCVASAHHSGGGGGSDGHSFLAASDIQTMRIVFIIALFIMGIAFSWFVFMGSVTSTAIRDGFGTLSDKVTLILAADPSLATSASTTSETLPIAPLGSASIGMARDTSSLGASIFSLDDSHVTELDYAQERLSEAE